MNYFAHGRQFLDAPYFLAGTAVPDWLSVVDRRVRVRSKRASLFVDDPDARMAALARGIVQHHWDDGWFHQTAAFRELNWQFTVELRERLRELDGFRPSFVGHVLVEVLLDASLADLDRGALDRYYEVVDQLDPSFLEEAIGTIAGRNARGLAAFIPRFSAARFLYDYHDDAKLLERLNMVMHRVRLPQMSPDVAAFFPAARRSVLARMNELLGESSSGVAQ